MKIHWGTGVVAAFVLFVAVILTLVVMAMSRDVDLVTDHPYDKGLAYQDRIRALERTAALEGKLTVTTSPGAIVVQFPSPAPRTHGGSITMYRPDNRGMDLTLPMTVDSAGEQRIPASGLARGLWRIKLSWQEGGRDYYSEQPIMLY
jgi:nitrogen fixation protein FixH